jgi:uncharacterized protein (TIGR02996 family)
MATSSLLDSASIPPEVRIFFRDIKEHPDDDTPRLIFADWLQEHGDAAAAARGEFLRLQVLRHRLTADDPSYGVLKRREGELFTEHRWVWLGPLADVATWTFERGMVQFTARAGKILTTEIDDWARTEAGLWIDALTLTDVTPHFAARLVRSPLLGHLNRLDLNDNRFQPSFGPLFRAPCLPYLTELVLSRNRLTVGHIACLAVRPHSDLLRVLDLQHNRLDDTAAQLLADSSYLKNLRVLRLGHNRLTADGVAVLRQAFGDRVSF